jgi:lipopolysaccharide/colanic/teichoic acid biosynthesis glycosyltransferase
VADPHALLKSQRSSSRQTSDRSDEAAFRPGIPFGEEVFQTVLMLERRRAERSRRPFMLMLLHTSARQGAAARILEETLRILISNTRESDLIGWYRKSVTLGVIFTEITEGEKATVAEALREKVEAALMETLGPAGVSAISISMHVFPEDWDGGDSSWTGDSKLYPELYPEMRQKLAKRHFQLGTKRFIDILGSAAILLITLPFLAVIALIIKLTSEGPVLFEQDRLGQFGARFKCLKFRTMYTNCDPKIHRDYVRQYISGSAQTAADSNSNKELYKLTADPRVTPIGSFLRKVSLDEFPQFWNVFRGEMSLVGPRPPVPYEFEAYDVWHRRRVLELKPGVTGLWQVSGRNRMRFDEMVRLDLRYSQQWSLWLDLKILLATPFAIFSGDCA